MRIAQIVGTVTLNRSHPSLAGGTFRLAVPYTLDELRDGKTPGADELVLYDELGAGIGSRVALNCSNTNSMKSSSVSEFPEMLIENAPSNTA